MKPHRSFCLTAAAALLTATLPLHAQSDPIAATITLVDPPQSQQGTGYPVTGRMVCADTQRAARFAGVVLISASSGDGNFGPGRRANGRTDLDGNFLIPNVAPGDYYVTGSLPGYVNQAQLVSNTLNAGGDLTALAGVPLVHVVTGGASAALSLQRGGVVAGVVQWDDGTPAAGVNVAVRPSTTSTPAQGPGRGFGNGGFGGFGGGQTDDRGRFRLSGLAPGSYFLSASVQVPAPQRPGDGGFSRTLSFTVYAPDKFRRTDATPLTVGSGEERADLTILLALSRMHAVSGTVSAGSAAVRSGTVNLTDGTDSSLNLNGTVSSDGSFVVPYVPPGTYTMRITASSQLPTFGRGGGNTDTTRFQPVQESITVTDSDLSGLAVTVTPATANSSQ